MDDSMNPSTTELLQKLENKPEHVTTVALSHHLDEYALGFASRKDVVLVAYYQDFLNDHVGIV